MNKIFFIAFFASLSFYSCNNQETDTPILEPQDTTKNEVVFPDLEFSEGIKPILFEYTSTGCPGCGSWGKSTFNALIAQHQKNIIPMAVHIKYGDPMITDYSNEIAANRHGNFYTPQLWVNDTNGVVISGGYIQGGESVNRLNNLIAQYQASMPNIKADIQWVKEGKSLEVKYGLKASQEWENVSVSCYLLENNIENNQSGYANNPATHNFVIRAAVGEETFGEKVAWKMKEDYTFEKTANISLEKENGAYQVVIVLWRTEGQRKVPVGGMLKNLK